MTEAQDSRLKSLRRMLRLTRAPLLHVLFENRIARMVVAPAQEDATANIVVILLLNELMESRSPRRSMFLLNRLQDLPEEIRERSPDLIDFLKDVPGSMVWGKVLICRKLLHRCFAGLEFTYGNEEPDGRTLSEVLEEYEGHDMSMKWLESLHGRIVWDCARAYLNRDPVRLQPDLELISVARSKAASGDSTAMFMLGVAQLYGYGTPPDPVEGVNTLKHASQLGNANAQATLGYMYLLGCGVSKDQALGKRLLEDACAGGSEEAGRALRYWSTAKPTESA